MNPVDELPTGDLLRLEGSTLLWLGRKGIVINFGGYKLHPEHLEEFLKARLDLEVVCVVGIPDRILGQRVVVFILEGREALVTNAVGDYIRLSGNHFVPLVYGIKELPLIGQGKTDRVWLCKLAESSFGSMRQEEEV
jgi:acyl-CoA synthetase (AMP-forming)/AMP-acid ligase II